jgi:hypothetical protein
MGVKNEGRRGLVGRRSSLVGGRSSLAGKRSSLVGRRSSLVRGTDVLIGLLFIGVVITEEA